MPIHTDKICIIGVPMDLGAGRRGVDMGPSAIRVADLEPKLKSLRFKVEDCGDLDVMIPETQAAGEDNLRFKDAILATNKQLMQVVRSALERKSFPLVVGGDHSLSIGSIAGTACHFAEQKKRIGVIWFDAHGDFNTPETTPSGNIHGMSLAVAAGMGDSDLVNLGGRAQKVSPENIVIIGARDLDEHEKTNIKTNGVTVYTMRDLDEKGFREVFSEAIETAGSGTEGIHLSFDLDVIDPQFAPGTGTPVRGGVSYREAHLAMEMLSDDADVLSMDLVEVNPVLDIVNQTAVLAVELVLSLAGKRIL